MPRPPNPCTNPDMSSASPPSPPPRLPVNHRSKQAAHGKRKRVVCCNHCIARRIKCSGDRPCHQCTRLRRECSYPAPVTATERCDRRPGKRPQALSLDSSSPAAATRMHSTLPDDDDDSVSIESNPFERTVMTEERLAHFRRIHKENPHPVYWGPPLEYPSPGTPPSGDDCPMSDRDDSVSTERNSFGRPTPLTAARLARHRKVLDSQLNPHVADWGHEAPPPRARSPFSDDPEISLETEGVLIITEALLAERRKIQEERTDGMYLQGRRIWPPSPNEPRRKTRHMLVGLANPFPDHGLKRSPTGRVRSWRLEAQRKRKAASQPPNKPRKVRKRKSTDPRASRAKAASQRRRAS